MDDVACISSHIQLIYCPSSILGTSNCGHAEDAGVGCEGLNISIIAACLYIN